MTWFDDKIGACIHVCLATMLWVHMQDYRGGSEVLQCQVPSSIVESVVKSGSWWITCGSKQSALLFLEMTCSWMIFVVHLWNFCSYNRFWIPREGQTVWWSIESIWIVPSTSTLVTVQLMSKVETYQPKVACDRKKERTVLVEVKVRYLWCLQKL